MNPLLDRLNELGNKTSWIRPMKWRLSGILHNAAYDYVESRSEIHFYRVCGIQRTGNHAVISWIMAHSKGLTVLCNDLDVSSEPREGPIKKLKFGVGVPSLITSYEEYKMGDLVGELDRYSVAGANKEYRLLLLRDPFNLFASRYAWKFEQGRLFREDADYRQQVVDLWKENARAYQSWEGSSSDGFEYITVNYNRWIVDNDYRKLLGGRLQLQQAEAGFNEVKDFGGGSSFEGVAPASESSERFLKRFDHFSDDPVFKAIFKDEELWDLSRSIFGVVAGSEKLRDSVG